MLFWDYNGERKNILFSYFGAIMGTAKISYFLNLALSWGARKLNVCKDTSYTVSQLEFPGSEDVANASTEGRGCCALRKEGEKAETLRRRRPSEELPTDPRVGFGDPRDPAALHLLSTHLHAGLQQEERGGPDQTRPSTGRELHLLAKV